MKVQDLKLELEDVQILTEEDLTSIKGGNDIIGFDDVDVSYRPKIKKASLR